MVDVFPFRALRFNSKNKTDVSKFICPPYDVISPQERETMGKKFPENVIHLELPAGEGDDKYSNAAKVLDEWRGHGQLQEDRSAAFYLLETIYSIDDSFAPKGKLKRYGILSALRLETPGKGSVKPHEKTLPKAKEDRLKLLSSLRTNVSPIFGLFFDKQKKWKALISRATKKKPLITGAENKNLTHRMWKIDDPAVQKDFRKLLSSKELYIADGHHRYEVAWAYRDSRLQEDPKATIDTGWRSVMAYICPMEESGLLMLPTHRLVKSNRTLLEWRSHLECIFDVQPVKKMGDILNILRAKTGTIGFVSAEGYFLLKLKKGLSIDHCLQNRPKALRELDVIVLHDLALGESNETPFLSEKEIVFTRDVKGIDTLVKKDRSWVGFMLASPGVDSLARVASAGEVMPPKTTYFFPKVPTGFTMMPLEQRLK